MIRAGNSFDVPAWSALVQSQMGDDGSLGSFVPTFLDFRSQILPLGQQDFVGSTGCTISFVGRFSKVSHNCLLSLQLSLDVAAVSLLFDAHFFRTDHKLFLPVLR